MGFECTCKISSKMEKSLEQFLRQRGVTEDVIDRLKAERIDAAVIHVMDDNMLSQFLPLAGDRVMVKDFCRQMHTKSGLQGIGTSRRDKLVKRIRHRLDLGSRQNDKDEPLSSSDDDEELPRRKVGNINALRPTRQVEIGWLCELKGMLKQVRQRQGGGTRKVVVPRTHQKIDVLRLSKDLFFPAGISPHGPATQFQFDVWNFKQEPMHASLTIGEIHEATKLPLLRFYLVSRPSMLIGDNETSQCITVPDSDEQPTMEQFRYISSGDEEGLPSIPVDDVPITRISNLASVCTTVATPSQCSDGSYWVSAGTPSVFFRSTSYLDPVAGCSSNSAGVHEQRGDVIIEHHSRCLDSTTSRAQCTSQNTTVHNYQHLSEVDVRNDNQELETGSRTSALDDHMGDDDQCDIQTAIIESLLQPVILVDWKSQLIQLQDQVSKENVPTANIINVVRGSALSSFCRAIKRKNFSAKHRLDVCFVDLADNAEGAIDNGGPTREFFRLLLGELVGSEVFEGPEHSKHLRLSTNALDHDQYFVAGAAIGLSLTNGGPSPDFLSPLMYNTLIGNKNSPIQVEDITDWNVRDKLTKINEVQSVELLAEAVDAAADILALLGSLRPVRTLDDRDHLMQQVLAYYMVGRLQPAYEQFKNGLEMAGVLDSILQLPSEWRTVFTRTQNAKLTSQCLLHLFLPQYSIEGSNERTKERVLVSFWRDWIIEVGDNESQVSLDQILAFATGADSVPPLGFPSIPQLQFNHEAGAKYHLANTCALILTLPVVTSYDTFKEGMEEGILQSPTFGFS